MKEQQYKAIIDYAKEYGYKSQYDLLYALRECGVLDENSPLEDLAEAVTDDSYLTMYNYLKGC